MDQGLLLTRHSSKMHAYITHFRLTATQWDRVYDRPHLTEVKRRHKLINSLPQVTHGGRAWEVDPLVGPDRSMPTGQAFSHHCQLLWAEQSAWERINRDHWKEIVRPNHEVSICQIQLGLLYLIHSTNIYWITMMCWLDGNMVIHQKDKGFLPMEFTVLFT